MQHARWNERNQFRDRGTELDFEDKKSIELIQGMIHMQDLFMTLQSFEFQNT
jgi:hypothetical protein